MLLRMLKVGLLIKVGEVFILLEDREISNLLIETTDEVLAELDFNFNYQYISAIRPLSRYRNFSSKVL